MDIHNDEDERFSDDDVFFSTRSRLYSLVPIGDSGWFKEGLRSYIIRLARAHRVSPRRLMRSVFGRVAPEITDIVCNRFYTRDGGTIDGLGGYAQLFSNAVSQLTLRNDIDDLTLLGWNALLPQNGEGVLSRHPCWCPLCLELQRRLLGHSYFPHVWSLALYRTCSIHRVPLLEVCPHCSKVQPFFPLLPVLGYCAHCHYALEATMEGPIQYVSDVSIEMTLEDMLSKMHASLQQVSLHNFKGNMSAYIDCAFEGNKALFCRSMGWDNWAVNGWLSKGKRPSLPKLAKLAVATHTSIFDLCTTFVADRIEVWPSVEDRSKSLVDRRVKPDLDVVQRESVGVVLATELTSKIPKALNQICRELKLRRSALKYWFPVQCRRICERHSADQSEVSRGARSSRRQLMFEIFYRLEENRIPVTRRAVNQMLQPFGLALARPELGRIYMEYVSGPRLIAPRTGSILPK